MNALILGAVLSAASAVVFGYVGYRTSLRPVSPDAYLASRTFMIWWYALGAVTAIGAVRNLGPLLGINDLAYYVTITYLNLLLVCIALWGLLFYLLYVYTGKRTWIGPLSAGYVAYFAVLVYYVSASQPSGILISNGDVRIEYAHELGVPLTLTLVSLLVGPQIIAAFAYFLLFFQVEERTQRFRIMIVSWSIILWFGATLGATLGGFSQFAAWSIISRLLALGAALAILTAFAPPAWLCKRFALHPTPESRGANHD